MTDDEIAAARARLLAEDEKEAAPAGRPPTTVPKRLGETERMPTWFAELSAASECAPLPLKSCPGCGSVMSASMELAGQRLYRHQVFCPQARERARKMRRARMGEQLRKLAQQAANIPKGEMDIPAYFEEFGVGPAFDDGFTAATQFLARCRQGKPPAAGFTLFGAVGAGKTTLAVALARSVSDLGITVRWEGCPQLLNRLMGLLRAGAVDPALGELQQTAVLFLDDLGRERSTPWWLDAVLFATVDARYQAGRPVICTTNFDWEELERRWTFSRGKGGEEPENVAPLIDRLRERAPSVRFGPERSLRRARFDFGEARP